MATRRVIGKYLGAAILAMASAGIMAPAAQADENYPTQTVRLIVPFAAGGGTDLFARMIAQELTTKLGQPFIVENRPGAGSLIGVTYVANAEPDGYTLLMASSSFVTNIVLGEEKPYDPIADFEPVTLVSFSPTLLVVNPDSVEAETMEDFIEAIRDNPGDYVYGTFGDRSQPHLSSAIWADEAGIEIDGVPYGGGGPAVTAVVSGEVDMLMPTITLVKPQVEAGQLRPLALAASERSSVLPDVPTFAEAGQPYEMGTWFGVVAPAGTDTAITRKVNDAIIEIIHDPETKAMLEQDGTMIPDRQLEDFRQFLSDEMETWTAVSERGLF